MLLPASDWANQLVTGLLTSLDQDGTLKAGAVDVSAVLADSVVSTAKLADGSVTAPKLADGACVQMVYNNSSTFATGTTTIPHDNTIPQNTEGTQFLSQTITPKSATNLLVIDVVIYGSYSVAAYIIGALFQDSGANAIAACDTYIDSATGSAMMRIRHTMVAGTTSATTFNVRCGGNVAGTFTFNGTGGASILSTITKSSIVITEYKAS